MKKNKLLFVFLFAFILLLTGCGEKTPITAAKFSSTMEDLGFVVSDEKEEREDYSYITSVIVAADSDHILDYYSEEDDEDIEEVDEADVETDEIDLDDDIDDEETTKNKAKIIKREYDPNYQIEFYVFDTTDNAKGFYNNNKAIFETEKTSTSTVSENSEKNYSKYLLDNGTSYMAISRIDNTIIYFSVAEDYKTTANSILNKFGY